MTRPSTPASATSRFDPPPITRTGTPFSRAQSSPSANSCARSWRARRSPPRRRRAATCSAPATTLSSRAFTASSASTRRSDSAVTSPAPIVSTRSPGLAPVDDRRLGRVERLDEPRVRVARSRMPSTMSVDDTGAPRRSRARSADRSAGSARAGRRQTTRTNSSSSAAVRWVVCG